MLLRVPELKCESWTSIQTDMSNEQTRQGTNPSLQHSYLQNLENIISDAYSTFSLDPSLEEMSAVSKGEALPILAYLAYVEDTTLANEAVAVVTIHYAQKLRIRHVVEYACKLDVPLRTLGCVATLDRFQGFQA